MGAQMFFSGTEVILSVLFCYMQVIVTGSGAVYHPMLLMLIGAAQCAGC